MTKLEKQREYKRQWRLKNKERCAEYDKQLRLKKEFNTDYIVSILWSGAKTRSNKRGREFTITKEQLYKRIVETNGFCELSGLPLSVAFNDPLRVSIDRIDSDIGYTPENIQIVASCVNIAKNNLHQDAFIQICKAVSEKTK